MFFEQILLLKSEVANLRGENGKALIAISSGSFLMIGVQMIYPVLIPEMRRSYAMDLTTTGLLLSILWAANAAGQLPGGVMADHIGDRTTLLVGVIISAGTLLLIVTVDSVFALFFATALFGLGLSLFGVARYTMMYTLYPDRAGTTVGIVLAAADAGQAVLPPLASIIAVTVAWQLGFGMTMPLFLLVGIALWIFVPASDSSRSEDSLRCSFGGILSIIRELRTKRSAYGSAVFVVYVCVWVSFTSFYPTYLIEVKDISSRITALIFGSFFLVGIIMKPLSGAAYDWVGIRGSLGAIAPVAGLALATIPFIESATTLFLATVLIAPILGTGAISQSFLINTMADTSKGTGLGLIRTSGMLIASLTPVVVGALADRGIFDEVFLVLAVLILGLLILVQRIP